VQTAAKTLSLCRGNDGEMHELERRFAQPPIDLDRREVRRDLIAPPVPRMSRDREREAVHLPFINRERECKAVTLRVALDALEDSLAR